MASDPKPLAQGTRRYPAEVGPAGPADLAIVQKAAELLGGTKTLRRRLTTQLQAHDLIVQGLPAEAVQRLLTQLVHIPSGNVAVAVGISKRTAQRHKKIPQKRLSEAQSARMWKFAEILAKATEVFGTRRDAEEWMNSPATGLEQRRPIDLLKTPAGAELVENFLERIEYGVYS